MFGILVYRGAVAKCSTWKFLGGPLLLENDVQWDALEKHLESFISVYPRLAMSLAEKYIQCDEGEDNLENEEDNEDIVTFMGL